MAKRNGKSKVLVACEAQAGRSPRLAFRSVRKAKQFMRALRRINGINCVIVKTAKRAR